MPDNSYSRLTVCRDISLCGREVREEGGEVASHNGSQRCELVPSLLPPIYSVPNPCQGAVHIRGSFLGSNLSGSILIDMARDFLPWPS